MKNPVRITARILPGLKPVLELLQKNPCKIGEILCRKNLKVSEKTLVLAESARIPVKFAEQQDLDRICADAGHLVAHQGLVAILKNAAPAVSLEQILADASSAPLPILLALDQVQDPGNLGTLARSAWALGASGILLPEHESAKPGPAALKSSAGALELLPVCQVPNLAKALDIAEENGFTIYGAGTEPGSVSVFALTWRFPAILVLGSEAKGIRPGVKKRCSQMLHIPFARPFDSLNVAQAGAMFLGLCAAAHLNHS